MARRRRRLAAAAIAAVSFVVPACDGGSRPSADARAVVEYVPSSAAFYIEATVHPEGEQAEALSELRALLPPDASETPWDDAVGAVFGAPLEALDLDFEADVEPWLGAQAAAFVTEGAEGETGLLFAVGDDAGAEAAIARVEDGLSGRATKTVSDTEYVTGRARDGSIYEVGVVDDYMVLAGEGGFRTVMEAADGESLQTSGGFDDATSGLPDDRLGMFYGDVSSLHKKGRIVDTQLFGRFLVTGALGDGTIAGTVAARSDALVLDTTTERAESTVPGPVLRGYARESTLDELPGHAWFALRIPKAGRALGALVAASGARRDPTWRRVQRALRKEWDMRIGKDVLSWMRGATVYAGGHSLQELDAGLLVRSAKPRKSMAFVSALGGFLHASGFRLSRLPSFSREVDFDVRLPTLPRPLHVTSTGGFSVTYGRTLQEAFREEGFLDYSKVFERATEALDDGYQPALFVDGEKARRFGESTFLGAGDVLPRTYVAGARPFLERLDYLVQGIDLAGDRVLQQIVIGVR